MRASTMLRSSVVLVLPVVLASHVCADQIYVYDTTAWNQSNFNGGPFEVQPIGFQASEGMNQHGAGAGHFITFCVETNEYLSQGGTYWIDINDRAIGGGSGGENPDPLDSRTAYLYTHFIRGTLSSELGAWGLASQSTFTDLVSADGIALQEAIWDIEQEQTAPSGFASDLLGLANWAIGGGNRWGANDIGNVRVMNMWTDVNHTGIAQDLLVMIPLPAPVWVASLGLIGVIGGSVFRRRSANGRTTL